MKLRTSHCAFALPYCHYNLYKHSFVFLCFWWSILTACVVAWAAIHCYSFLTYFLFFIFLFLFFSRNAIKLHTRFHLDYCIFAVVIVCFCALLYFVCLSRNKKITYLLTYLLTYLHHKHVDVCLWHRVVSAIVQQLRIRSVKGGGRAWRRCQSTRSRCAVLAGRATSSASCRPVIVPLCLIVHYCAQFIRKK